MTIWIHRGWAELGWERDREWEQMLGLTKLSRVIIKEEVLRNKSMRVFNFLSPHPQSREPKYLNYLICKPKIWGGLCINDFHLIQ